jgi:hypothetical protein
VPGRGEAAQVSPELRDEDLGDPPSDARDRVQPLDCRLERAHLLLNDGAQLGHACVQIVDVRQHRGNQIPLVGPEVPGQGTLELGVLLLELPEREVRQHRRVRLTSDERLEHATG